MRLLTFGLLLYISVSLVLADYNEIVSRAAVAASRGEAKNLARKNDLQWIDLTNKENRTNPFDMYLEVRHFTATNEERYTALPVLRQINYKNQSSDLSPGDLYLFESPKLKKALRKTNLRQMLQHTLLGRDELIVVNSQASAIPIQGNEPARFRLNLFHRSDGPKGYLCFIATKAGTSKRKLGADYEDLELGPEWAYQLVNDEELFSSTNDLVFLVTVPIHKGEKRDKGFPIRLLVHFLVKTTSGEIDKKQMSDISAKLERVFEDPLYGGTLLVNRTTKESIEKRELPEWWTSFWQRNGKNIGLRPNVALRLLQRRKGKDYWPKSEKSFRDDVADLLVLADW